MRQLSYHELQLPRRSKSMNLVLDLPADLEAIIKRRAEQAGLDVPTYVLQTLRISAHEVTSASGTN